jgi:hypothetical protein
VLKSEKDFEQLKKFQILINSLDPMKAKYLIKKEYEKNND